MSKDKDPMDHTILDCLEEFKGIYSRNPNAFHGIIILTKMEDDLDLSTIEERCPGYLIGGGLKYLEAIGMLTLNANYLSNKYIKELTEPED